MRIDEVRKTPHTPQKTFSHPDFRSPKTKSVDTQGRTTKTAAASWTRDRGLSHRTIPLNALRHKRKPAPGVRGRVTFLCPTRAEWRTRTADPRITNALLYQLSQFGNKMPASEGPHPLLFAGVTDVAGAKVGFFRNTGQEQTIFYFYDPVYEAFHEARRQAFS